MSKRVLVIEHDEVVRRLFRLALEHTDCHTDEADSAEKGVEKARTNAYDLIFFDLEIPGIDGIVTLRELRGIDPNVPIYVATHFYVKFLDRLRNASRSGLQFEVLEKPITVSEVTSIATSASEKRAEPPQSPTNFYEFELYVVGGTENASRAVRDLENLLKSKFNRQYSLKIINILENPRLAEEGGVLATPTVVRINPKPVRRVVGSLSEAESVFSILCSDDTD